jgi:hypothetical protein
MAPLMRVEDAALLPVPSDGAPSPPQPTKLRQGFVALAEALLKSLAEVFPECDAVDRGVQLFANLVKGDAQREDEFIRKCHAVFQRHGAAFKAREPESLFQAADALPILRDVGFRSKWVDPGFDEQSKENLWQYLQSLKLYAELFCAVPASVMGKIECVATELGERLKSGDLDLSKMDIADLGQRLLGQLGAEELANFEGSLPSIYASIAEMASSLASQAGHPDLDVEALMKSVVAGQQPGGPVDFSAVMQRIGGLVDPGSTLGGGEGGLNPQQLLGLAQSAGPLLAALQRGGAAAPVEPAAALQDRRSKAGKRRQ